jgi:NodT family efflux transporter outer membrane factor (OMF) lipoprotein
VAAAGADRDAAAAALDLVRLTVASETARAYVDACAANMQIAVAEHTLDLQSRTAGLTQTLLDNGRTSGLEVAGAQTAVATTRASLSPLRSGRDNALFRLAVLAGKPPEQLDPAASACAAIPVLSSPIPVGDGKGLLARRPDVRQADRQLAAAAARAGVAMADLYPTISLGGSISQQAARLGDLGSQGLSFSLGPLISWNFPNLAAAKARVAGAQAGADVALAHFDSVTLNALKDTETALSAYANQLDQRAALATARQHASEAEQLSQIRYDQGADPFLTLLDAQRTLAQTDAALAQASAAVAEDQVTLFQALGGGWQPQS